jgi:hypothetical protein
MHEAIGGDVRQDELPGLRAHERTRASGAKLGVGIAAHEALDRDVLHRRYREIASEDVQLLRRAVRTREHELLADVGEPAEREVLDLGQCAHAQHLQIWPEHDALRGLRRRGVDPHRRIAFRDRRDGEVGGRGRREAAHARDAADRRWNRGCIGRAILDHLRRRIAGDWRDTQPATTDQPQGHNEDAAHAASLSGSRGTGIRSRAAGAIARVRVR